MNFYLDKTNLSFYLFEKRLITWEDYQNQSPNIKEKKLNNYCFIIEIGQYHYFVKQLKSNDASYVDAFYNELRFYKNLPNKFSFIPQFYYFDFINNIIISRAVNAENLADDKITSRKLEQIITVLNEVHNISVNPAIELNNVSVPWIFDLINPETETWINKRSGETTSVIKILKEKNDLIPKIGQLAVKWASECLVHGDLKFNNWLYDSEKESIYLVDWEMAGWGDSIWEIAEIMSSLIMIELLNSDSFLLIGTNIEYDQILENENLEILLPIIVKKSINIDWNNETLLKLIQFTACNMARKLILNAQNSNIGLKNHEITGVIYKLITTPEKYLKIWN